MSQDLRQISAGTLRLEVFKLTISQIKKLIESIYEFKRSSIGSYIALDLERKETILMSEMMRRGYFMPKRKPQEQTEYNQWIKRNAKKRRLF